MERRGSPPSGERTAEDATAAEAAPPTSRPSLLLDTPKHKGVSVRSETSPETRCPTHHLPGRVLGVWG